MIIFVAKKHVNGRLMDCDVSAIYKVGDLIGYDPNNIYEITSIVGSKVTAVNVNEKENENESIGASE